MTTTAQSQQPQCEQTDTTATAPCHPAPGTEYPFSISDIAHATAQLLGEGWSAESGPWGTSGVVSSPYPTGTGFEFLVDYECDLVIHYERYACDAFPENPELPRDVHACDGGIYLGAACAADGLEDLARRSAAAIRAITGR
ncbi:hypothetical protein AB0B04_18915 [Streptomyces xinghaiensis]|uniref:Uncharacterized protein n=2 Tax=Streptomyces TaxID=1883 RepID=A0A3R7HX23_9ACTN|nr:MULTISPECIES: hypothetical protein [Streptomyces]KNE78790.1 hypothetical protein ADZ36_31255 [Streptomyces fradiae]OFA36649.1 hypothetical protein BEN35_29780 [Streptomyces fradiae]PQM20646.1 hypothetical protein Sfr7A_26025 [Streptomyces xinghaiensis]RKM92586.1 hypothetical protein SFRA_024680 [Streptomyces xinghaiensis]RNC70554.1 hypothetical protein DC095_025670 [Streptomyces xinghaiensis]